MNPVRKLQKQGQSLWLDWINRDLITSGELYQLVREGLSGITSNPTIFLKSFTNSSDYENDIREYVKMNHQTDVCALFEKLATMDIRKAADVLRPVYDKTDGSDGFICLELSPHLAHDVAGSVTEACHLWKTIDRPNIMLKIPATHEGILASETLIAKGINVNMTLLFSISHYEAAASAYMRGLRKCSNPNIVTSAVSFFLSRMDRVIDKILEDIGTHEALKLQGKIAIANAKMVYKRFKEVLRSKSWEQLAKQGAHVQRILWASTSTKNPAYPSLLYLEKLIGPHTIITISPDTLRIFLEHGQVRPTLEDGEDAAETSLRRLAELGVNISELAERLQLQGLNDFTISFDKLLSVLREKCFDCCSLRAHL